jgi:peptidoglycan/LPS O-acetylase OafA/YrhL
MDATTGQIHATTSTGVARYRRDVDGLRAVAVTSVVLFHTGLGAIKGGFVGVDIFFVISGFLIGGIVDREIAGGSFSFARFYVRRARRIAPALLAVSIATLLLGLILLGPSELRRLAASIGAAIGGTSNLWFFLSANYFAPDARVEPFLMTWSLGIEEQFYVLLPPLLLVLRRVDRRATMPAMAVMTLASFALSIVLTDRNPSAAFYLLPTRAWELGIGVLLALLLDARPARLTRGVREGLGVIGLGAIIAAITLFDEHLPFPGFAALLPVLGTAALIAADGSAINRRLLAAAPLVGIGLISYSWYLWHWPLIALTRVVSAAPPTVWQLLVVVAASLILAWLSWRFIERPFRHPSKQPSNGAVLVQYGMALAAVMGLSGAIYAANGLPQRMNPDVKRVEAILAESRGGPCLANYGDDRPSMSASCVGAPVPRIALLGDSHAAALGTAFRAAAAAHGHGFVQFTKASCPALLGATRAMPNHPGHAGECLRYNDAAIEAVARDPAIDTVIITGFWQVPFDPSAIAGGDAYVDGNGSARPSETEFATAIRRTAARLRGAGKIVVVLADVPGLRFDPARHAMTGFLSLRRAAEGLVSPAFEPIDGQIPRAFVSPTDDIATRLLADSLHGMPGVRYAALADLLCTPSLCRFADRTTPWYIDPQHLSRPGAAAVVAKLDGLVWAPR